MTEDDVDVDNTFELQSTCFPVEVVRLRKCYEDDECRKGWTYTFIQCFLCCRQKWRDTFSRQVQRFKLPIAHALVKVSLIDEDEQVYDAFGCGVDCKRASDIACYRLSERLFEKLPDFFMPPNLIGFPNIRGHCFLIAAILPIYYSYPIMRKLFQLNYESVRDVNLGLGLKRPSKRPRVETPRMWVQSLFRCYKDFHKVSLKGHYDMLNVSYLQKKLNPQLRNNPNFPDKPVNPRYDLLLDVALVKGICNMLGNYCNTDYLKPGGDECQAYGFIMSKLCSSNPELIGEFLFRFKTTSVCGNCCNGPYTYEFAQPYVTVPADMNFQDLLNKPVALATAQKLSHTHLEPLYCPGKLRDIDSCEFIEHPEILCIRYDFGKSEYEVNIPDKLKLKVGNKIEKYRRLCSSVVIKCYVNYEGEPYPPFYRKPIFGDEFDSWHTYIQIKTSSGWFEVNNGMVYPIDDRLFKIATPGSLHFYQLKKYDEFLPEVHEDTIDYFPDR